MEYKSFTEFRRELEDLGTVYLCRGGKLDGVRCPLGIVTAQEKPNVHDAALVWGLRPDDARNFANAYDGFERALPYSDNRFFSLGRAYRNKFVLGVKS